MRIADIYVGRQFNYNGITYVLIPEMLMKCGRHEFHVNVIHIDDDDVIASYFPPDYGVELVEESGPAPDKVCLSLEKLKKEFPDATTETWHQHSNGGGWVENTAHAAGTAFVGSDAFVFGMARVYDYARVYGKAEVFGNAVVHGSATQFQMKEN